MNDILETLRGLHREIATISVLMKHPPMIVASRELSPDEIRKLMKPSDIIFIQEASPRVEPNFALIEALERAEKACLAAIEVYETPQNDRGFGTD